MDEQTYLARLQAAEQTLYHVACTLLSSESDRRDAMQETALRTWQHRNELREEQYFTTWAVRILINACRSQQRNQRRLIPTDTVADAPAPSSDIELRLMLEGLPPKLRLPLVLHYLEGFSVEEIALAIGIPSGTVKYRLHQARKLLRIEMTEGKEG